MGRRLGRTTVGQLVGINCCEQVCTSDVRSRITRLVEVSTVQWRISYLSVCRRICSTTPFFAFFDLLALMVPCVQGVCPTPIAPSPLLDRAPHLHPTGPYPTNSYVRRYFGLHGSSYETCGQNIQDVPPPLFRWQQPIFGTAILYLELCGRLHRYSLLAHRWRVLSKLQLLRRQFFLS